MRPEERDVRAPQSVPAGERGRFIADRRFCALRDRTALLGDHYLDQAERAITSRRRRCGFPTHPTLLHYTAALFSYRGWQGLVNSLIDSLGYDRAVRVAWHLMAYSLARFNTGGQHLAFWVLSQRFLPPVAIVLPIFLLYRNIGLYDTHVGLVLLYTVFTLPLTVWMMYTYFRQVPRRSRRPRWSMG